MRFQGKTALVTSGGGFGETICKGAATSLGCLR